MSNSALTLVKLIVGTWSGSVGILSEAVHSSTDLVASIIALFAVRASDTPPDPEHPYGHGKIESVSGLVEAMLIFGAAGYILYEIAARLKYPTVSQSRAINAGIVVMAFSMVANIFISRMLSRVARETDSEALRADAAHLNTDVITSFGVFLGLLLVRTTGVAWYDSLVAAGVAILLVVTAVKLTRDAMRLLLDYRLPHAEEQLIIRILEDDPRVLGFHKLRTRKSGSMRHADVHVQMDDECTLVFAHEVTESIEDAIRAALPGIVINIHIEPYHYEMRHQKEMHGGS